MFCVIAFVLGISGYFTISQILYAFKAKVDVPKGKLNHVNLIKIHDISKIILFAMESFGGINIKLLNYVAQKSFTSLQFVKKNLTG